MLPDQWPLLALAAFFAGTVDAVVGGGGLIQVPALLTIFPGAAIPVLFGTNKVASIVGTGAAALHFVRRVKLPWAIVVPATIAALVGAFVGAACASALPRRWMVPLVIALLVTTAVHTFLRKEFGRLETRGPVPADRPRGAVLGGLLGFYDGIFGPGTGSFLIFGFVRFFGFDLVRANAATKIVNTATNFAALAFFIAHGAVMWPVALMMAACNLLGAQLGARIAIRWGSVFLRRAFLVVVVSLIAKLMWDFVTG
ncbi:sulfite exporter TauE/SafE family protein [Siculibacillus lacustris]|uniref:Probable membrane transporter protein n=1 Tax=Siculibacillus lacustris TaxID=1549641 RepID=A0A4Q9VX88_9HYPH|nr:TSUP family transporter [Siculibacillus lacustris]TBW40891.1 sulfite exporter TauE/SafE family protein [Siculibacillus lacustris]